MGNYGGVSGKWRKEVGELSKEIENYLPQYNFSNKLRK
jgi:hypothetical protein